MKTISLLVCLLALATFKCAATPFENGDFQKEKSRWQGNGSVVYLGPDGTVSETQSPGSTPAIQIKLNSNELKELKQNFTTGKGGRLQVSITYKGSADFARNDKSTLYTPNNTWKEGTIWYWSAFVIPRVDLCIRLEKTDGYCYKLEKVNPGSDWQTKTFAWDNVAPDKDVTLLLEVAPGHGSLLLKSFTAVSQ